MTDLILPDKPALELYNYQKNWVQDDSRFKIAMFARQCGKTFTSTLELALDCVKADMAGGRKGWGIVTGKQIGRASCRERVSSPV